MKIREISLSTVALGQLLYFQQIFSKKPGNKYSIELYNEKVKVFRMARIVYSISEFKHSKQVLHNYVSYIMNIPKF